MPDPNLSVHALTEARESVRHLLEALDLDAYLFEIEHRDGDWQLRIECPNDRGWQATVIPLDIERVNRGRRDAEQRSRLLANWGKPLAACRRSPPGSR